MGINIKTTNNYFERTETLVSYYHDVNGYDVLTAEQEKELFTLLSEAKGRLAKAKENKDRITIKESEREISKIRDIIVNANLRFVISIARVYGTNSNILDLINEGNIGLVEAVDSFDVTLGNRFQTHAVYAIRRKINLFRQNEGLMIRKNNESKTYHVISNMTNKFMQEFNREPTSDELKDYINEHYPNAKIKDSADVLNIKMSSIDEPVEGEDGDANIGNITTYNTYSATYNDYESKIESEDIRALVDSLMKNLSERDKSIIKMHFGIGQRHNSPVPVSEISERVGLTPERVRQLITEIKNKLKTEYSSRLDIL